MKIDTVVYKRRQKLTERQEEVLDFICETISIFGFPPTRMEICERFGFRSPNAAQQNIEALKAKGYIAILHSGGAKDRRAGRVSRGIKVL